MNIYVEDVGFEDIERALLMINPENRIIYHYGGCAIQINMGMSQSDIESLFKREIFRGMGRMKTVPLNEAFEYIRDSKMTSTDMSILEYIEGIVKKAKSGSSYLVTKYHDFQLWAPPYTTDFDTLYNVFINNYRYLTEKKAEPYEDIHIDNNKTVDEVVKIAINCIEANKTVILHYQGVDLAFTKDMISSLEYSKEKFIERCKSFIDKRVELKKESLRFLPKKRKK